MIFLASKTCKYIVKGVLNLEIAIEMVKAIMTVEANSEEWITNNWNFRGKRLKEYTFEVTAVRHYDPEFVAQFYKC